MFSPRSHKAPMSDKSEHEHVARAAAWLVLGVTSGLALDLCGKKLLES